MKTARADLAASFQAAVLDVLIDRSCCRNGEIPLRNFRRREDIHCRRGRRRCQFRDPHGTCGALRTTKASR